MTTAIPEAQVPGYLALKESFDAMMANAESREMVMRAIKIAKPNVTNELDVAERIAKPLREELHATNKKLAEFQQDWLAKKAADEETARVRQFEAQWADQENVLRREGYMEGAIAGIKDLAAKKGIVDLRDAAAVYDKTTPPASVAAPRFGSLALLDGSASDGADDYMAKLFKGAGSAPGETRKQVKAAIEEVRFGRAA